MVMTRSRATGWLSLATVALTLAVGDAREARQRGRSDRTAAAARVAIDADDIGGTVMSDEGPEGGVWVIAESTALPTRFVRIVVTDDSGRYVVPDLPPGPYELFVRGYGLVNTARVPARPGRHVDFTVETALTEREAAVIYPAAWWLTVMRVPPTGPIHPEELTRTVKTCTGCHQMGNPATRELPASFGHPASHLDAWDERLKRGLAADLMTAQFARLRRQRTMFSEWSERVVAGSFPVNAPSRPSGVERNFVITLWDWGGPTTFVPQAAASDTRDPRVRPRGANSRVYGPAQSHDSLLWIDPAAHTAGEIPVPTRAPRVTPTSVPHVGSNAAWVGSAEPASIALDSSGRLWIASRHRATDEVPAFCRAGSTNPFAARHPLDGGSRQATVYDPATKRFVDVDTCFTAGASVFGTDERLYFAAERTIGWIDTQTITPRSALADHGAVQGWCALPEDRSGRPAFMCRQPAAAPDGSIWCASGGEQEDRVARIEIGANPPSTCRAEIFRMPRWRDADGARGIDIDGSGVAWINAVATDHIASFDRRACRTLDDPRGTGEHCPEGWRFYNVPGQRFTNASPVAAADTVLRGGRIARTTDLLHRMIVDRWDVLGLNEGRDVPMAPASNSDAVVALLPQSGRFVTLRVPYPMGYYGRSLHPRIDDARQGWKGRGLWSNFASQAPWHIEGGPGTKGKLVKFQARPDPLAK